MKKLSVHRIFVAYLALILCYFAYASATGTRILGDDKEEFEPNGSTTSRGSSGYRGSSYYHK